MTEEQTREGKTVLFVVRKLDIGGMERMFLELVSQIAQSGFKVIVCTIEDPGVWGPTVAEKGIELVHLDKSPGLSWTTVQQLRSLMRARQVDLIHTHNSTAHFYAAVAKATSSRPIPLIHTKHGRGTPNITRSVWRNRISACATDIVVAVSEDIRSLCLTVEKVPGRKLQTIVNGIDVSRFRRGTRTFDFGSQPQIGHVGRLADVKNQAMILRVFRRIVDKIPDAQLRIIGGGPMLQALRNLAGELNLNDQVEFAGECENIPDALQRIDLFLLSSFSEGTPVALVEAMAAGCPAVATNVGGVGKVIDNGQSGYLVASEDDDAMYEKCMEILTCPDLAQSMSNHAIRAAEERFGLRPMIDSYLRLYRSVLSPENDCEEHASVANG